jgi:ABC-type nitrate/sulfonate/bicarbonate transport system ATPase subunit
LSANIAGCFISCLWHGKTFFYFFFGFLVRNLSMSFPGKRPGEHIDVLETINAEVARAEFVCLVGPSGCGKSTLLNIAAGFLDAASGEVLVEGESVRGPDRRRIFVFQENGVFPWLNVRENVGFGLRNLATGRVRPIRRGTDSFDRRTWTG